MTKKLILVFGALGVISFFIPTHGVMMIKGLSGPEKGSLIMMLLAFIVPVAMAGMAMSKPPMQKWQAGVALAGFALACVKLRVWETLPHIGTIIEFLGIPFVLMLVAAIGGVIVSIMGLVKGEESA